MTHPKSRSEPPAIMTEYAVLCPRDGKIRDKSTPFPVEAARWAANRDVECGKCYPESGRHRVVMRAVSRWTPVDNDGGEHG